MFLFSEFENILSINIHIFPESTTRMKVILVPQIQHNIFLEFGYRRFVINQYENPPQIYASWLNQIGVIINLKIHLIISNRF